MTSARKPYPFDVSDGEWALVAPYLTILPEKAVQREHSLREVFNGLRDIIKSGAPWRWMPNDPPS
jgi:transposase